MDTMPRLELVVRGLKREQAGSPSKPRLPITPVILRQVRAVWKDSQEWDVGSDVCMLLRIPENRGSGSARRLQL